MDKKALFTALMIAAGCQRGAEGERSAGEPGRERKPPTGPATERSVAEQQEVRGQDVIAAVDGVELKRADAEAEAMVKLGDSYENAPQHLRRALLQRMLDEVVEQFIARNLLLKEADRRAIKVTAQEEEEAFARIQANLPSGKTVKELMRESPMGEERMRQEVLTGIRINKLLGAVITNEVVITGEEVAAFVQKNKQRLQRPERVHARHILFSVAAGDDEATRALKKRRAEEVRKRLLEGADFAQAAKEYSGCPSAGRGGDLGEFPRGRMAPSFEEAAFSQAVNEIGPVIETKFGYHIVQVLERFAADRVPDEDVRNMLRNRKYQENVKTYVEGLKPGAEIKISQ